MAGMFSLHRISSWALDIVTLRSVFLPGSLSIYFDLFLLLLAVLGLQKEQISEPQPETRLKSVLSHDKAHITFEFLKRFTAITLKQHMNLWRTDCNLVFSGTRKKGLT